MNEPEPSQCVSAEDELRVSELRYRRLFETSKDGILILNAETGRVVDVNPFLIDLLGYSRETFVGTLVQQEDKVMLAPDYKKMYVPIEVTDTKNAELGYKVLVRLKEWKADAEYPSGVVDGHAGCRAGTFPAS